MRRFGRQSIMTYVIVGLMIIGLLYSIGSNFSKWIIPVAVFGLIFLLYRYPPSSWRYLAQRFRSGGFGGFGGRGDKTFGKKTKKAKFTVIRGSKPDDDEPPKYH